MNSGSTSTERDSAFIAVGRSWFDEARDFSWSAALTIDFVRSS